MRIGKRKYNYVTFYRLIVKLMHWLMKLRYDVFSPAQFIYLLSILVGFISGIYALLIVKMTVFVSDSLLHGLFKKYDYYYFIFPVLGLFLTYLFIRIFIKEPITQGMPSTLRAITNHGYFKDKYQTFSSLITVPLTVGLGGSAGLEGPTVVSSASLSTSIARRFKLDRKTRVLIIGCAAVGAMSSLFKAPMAAIVFAIEVFALDFTLTSMVPLLLSSIAAITTSYFFNDNDVLFPVRIIGEFKVLDMPYYILLGVFCGLASVAFITFYKGTDNFFKKYNSPVAKILIGGLTIGVITFFFPPIFGQGVEQMNEMLRGNGDILMKGTHFEPYYNKYTIIIFILAVGALKTIATSTTLNSEGAGGIFGPSLFIGCTLGNGFAKVLNVLGFNISEVNFTLVGMSGLLAGILHAPLTAIFLIAEISNGYALIVPIMVVGVISFAINRYYFKIPFYKQELAKRGELTTHDKDFNVLKHININKAIDTDIKFLYTNQNLGDLVKLVESSTKDIFPVLNSEEKLMGIININDCRKMLFDAQLYGSLPISKLMSSPVAIVNKDKDDIQTILQKFEETNSWILPVLKEGTFYGLIFKSKLLNLYRKKLKDFDYNSLM